MRLPLSRVHQDRTEIVSVRRAWLAQGLIPQMILIPYIGRLREKPIFTNETAILLMDSAPAHRSELVLRLLGENEILTVVFPAHTTTIF
jgi:hypothetical protein